MAGAFQAVQISDHVYWVGAIDWGIRDFHGYSTSRGTTYNAFLVMAEKIALIDTVKAPFEEEMFSRIASVVDPARIDVIVSNHSEMDHTGCLPSALTRVKPEKVFASAMGAKALSDHFHLDREITVVKEGEPLSLGNMDLAFIETRMLHWPDSMMSYLAEDEVLFSQDAFGMHLASSGRFADEIDRNVLRQEATRYYANILLPYSPLVTKLLEKVQSLGIPISILAPDHGPLWRRDIETPPLWYGEWASQKPTKKAVIVFDTMWQSTAHIARAIEEGLAGAGVDVRIMPLASCHRSDVVTEVLDAGALLVGSSTLNNNMLPRVADVLTYLTGLKPQHLVGTAFGSFGWSGEAVGLVADRMQAMRIEPVGDTLKVRYVPDAAALDACRALGREVADKLKRICDDS